MIDTGRRSLYRGIPSALALAVLCALLYGCSQKETRQDLGNGFELVTRDPTVIAPHSLSWGTHDMALYSTIDGRRVELERDYNVPAFAFEGGVLVIGYYKMSIYHPGKREPVVLDDKWCDTWTFSGDRRSLICTMLGEGKPRPPAENVSVRGSKPGEPVNVTVTRFDSDAKIVNQFAVRVAPPSGTCEGANVHGSHLTNDLPVVNFECPGEHGFQTHELTVESPPRDVTNSGEVIH